MARDHERRRSRSRSPNHRSKSGRGDRDRQRDRKRIGLSEKDSRRGHSSRHRSRSHSTSNSPTRASSHHRSSHRSSRSPGGHRRHRDRSRSSSKNRSTDENVINRERVEDIIGGLSYQNFDIDEQQQRLERIMQERRERIEKWRLQHKIVGTVGEEKSKEIEVQVDKPKEEPEPKKTWTLDDENDDEEEEDDTMDIQEASTEEGEEEHKILPPKREVKEEEEEDKIEKVVKGELNEKEVDNGSEQATSEDPAPVLPEVEEVAKKEDAEEVEEDDPLDAFMKGIQAEVKKYRSTTVKANKDNVTVMLGVAKKKGESKKRGELMEQNQDALEYSSNDEMDKEDEMGNSLDGQSKTKQKKLLTISKDDITYIPFRKAFYIEVPEISKMTNEEVENYKTEMEGIKTKGKGCPRPIKTWAQCGTSKKVLEVLKKNNYEKPTPIQSQAVPAIMSGRDLIGIAKTGSGKTLAYLLPMFRHILDQPPLESGEGAIAIVMIPTRELATQIYAECRKFAKPLGLRVVAVYGGTPISEQIGDLKPGAEIIVCTPGRMIDMLAANSGRVTNLRRCTYVVLDEADRMFDMGFEPQVMRIIDNVRPDRQTVMFSATFPRIMEALARRILDKPIEVQVGGRSVVCKEVEQSVIVIKDDDKFLKLLEILGKYSTQGSAITFVDKQEHADMLLKELMHASYTVLALHGGIDQNDRDSTIADFKNGKVNVLVATSVAARGLDVKHCIVVINYDCPNHYEDYVHRCGRTGRAGNKGYAYTFVTPEQGRYSQDLIKALEQSGNPIPEDLQKLFDEFKREQELLGKKVKSSSGFTGKGFKFDEAEAMQAVEKKKMQKAALGLQDSDDEEEEEEDDIDKAIETIFASKKKVTIVGTSTTSGAASTTTSASSVDVSGKSVTEKLELARQRASILTMSKGQSSSGMGLGGINPLASATAQTEAILKGDAYNYGSIANAVNAKSLAEQRAEALNAKLNYIPKDFEYNENGDIIKREDEMSTMAAAAAAANGNTRYEEELEINDAPQQARWKVTSKEAIATISEFSEAGITVRGTYYPPGKEPGPGDRKLYLAIEGMSEIAVSKAKSEIYRLIKDEMAKVKLNNSYQPGATKGRYKVL